MDGDLVFDVKGFTTYSSEEETEPGLELVGATMLGEIKALLADPDVPKAVKKKLKGASKTLARALKFLQKGNTKKGFPQISKTVKNLNKVKGQLPAATNLIEQLVDATTSEAQSAINSAIWSLGDPDLIAKAVLKMADAQELLNQGKPDKAIKAYQKAWQFARKADTGAGDLIPPVVTAPGDILVVATGGGGIAATDPVIQAFLAGATASDNADGDLSGSVTHDAPDNFPVGVTIVTFSVIDAAGNGDSDSAIVEVAPLDEDAPDNTSIVINNNAQYALSLSQFSARLMASDNVAVTDYLITEHNATDPANVVPPYVDPLPGDGRWMPARRTRISTP
jgi:hypothetical protein